MVNSFLCRVIHVIPYFGIGGVERAAETMQDIKVQDLSFNVIPIFGKVPVGSKWTLWNPFHYLKTVGRIYREAPNILIVSLWRSCIVGLFLKLFMTRLHLVLFLHYPRDVHFLDRILTHLASAVSSEIWTDSSETLMQRVSVHHVQKARVISFLTQHLTPRHKRQSGNHFVFWGRLSPQKDLLRAIRLFANVHRIAKLKDIKFYIIGPDAGELKRLMEAVSQYEVGDNVIFLGEKSLQEIRRISGIATFYLQTSLCEGMALSVVESMQLGLIPVVTPVGEIKHYAKDKENAILIKDDYITEATLVDLLENPSRCSELRYMALRTWEGAQLYKDEVLLSCRRIVSEMVI
jgi:glycosyltransferase involved in cell wall biosynthesis